MNSTIKIVLKGTARCEGGGEVVYILMTEMGVRDFFFDILVVLEGRHGLDGIGEGVGGGKHHGGEIE